MIYLKKKQNNEVTEKWKKKPTTSQNQNIL